MTQIAKTNISLGHLAERRHSAGCRDGDGVPDAARVISDVAHPEWRGTAVGVYRLWRDGGYALGALTAGLLADALGMSSAFATIGGLTLLSGLVAARVIRETLPGKTAP